MGGKLQISLKQYLIVSLVFTLPMFTQLNNYLLGAFVIFGLLEMVWRKDLRQQLKLLPYAWPVISLFILALMACIREWNWDSWYNLERYWSFVLLPLVLVSDYKTVSKNRRNIFLSLLYGTLITFLLCYGNLFYRMAIYQEPLNHVFWAEHVRFGFTDFADSHPAYLGLFAIVSIVFLFTEKKMSSLEKAPHVLLLMLGIFQLAGRTALLLLLILFVFLLFRRFKRSVWQALILFLGLILISLAYLNFRSSYMENRLFNIEAYTEDYRLPRWGVSYDIFRENPAWGVGYSRVRELRRELYRERNLPFGQSGDYNAHNQFLEYTSTNGAIGGAVYVLAVVYLLLLSFYHKDLIFVFLFSAFIVANMTESMLVRIKGIEFFALFATIFICGLFENGRERVNFLHKSAWLGEGK